VSRVLETCEEAGATVYGCIQHGTHFGVAEVAVNPDEVSDGHHTFGELYAHRRALTAVLAAAAATAGDSWRSKAHHPDDGPMFPGYFIVGIVFPNGPVTYHYEMEHWEDFRAVPEREHAPKWDGSTPDDSVARMLELARLLADDPVF